MKENLYLKRSLCRKSHLPWQKMQDKILALNTEGKKVHELNMTAAWVWENIETPIFFKELLASMLAEFDVDSDLATKDLIDLLEEFDSQGLLQDGLF